MVTPAPSEHPFKPADPHRGLFFACDLHGSTAFAWATLIEPLNRAMPMPSREYSLPDTGERIYENQLTLEAAIMELSIWADRQGGAHVDENIR